MMRKIIKNIPNTITILRGALGVTLLPALFFSGNILGALITFVSLGATDLIDGALARILKAESKFGKQADPVCDKALGISSLVLSSVINPMMLISLALESSIAVVGYARYRKEKDQAYVIKIGKLKMVPLFITTILSFIAVLNPIFLPFQIGFLTITSILQGITLYENIQKLNEKEIQTPVIENKEYLEIKEPEKEEQKQVKKAPTLKDKYLAFRKELDNLISSKEAGERKILEKGFEKRLKK